MNTLYLIFIILLTIVYIIYDRPPLEYCTPDYCIIEGQLPEGIGL